MSCACGRGTPGWKPDPGVCPRDDEHGPAKGHCACIHEPDGGVEPRVTAPDARQSDELREALARWMFERSETWRDLCSPEDADWGEWVERNREAWREEADVLLSLPMVTAWAEKQARERAAAEARKTADAWQWKAWFDMPLLVTERIGAAQYVTDWLRARAAALTADDRTDPA